MSMLLMVKAMQIKVGNPLRKLVLIKLADNANDLGECWPSYQHIADQCEIGRSTVRKHIKDLESAGLLRVENRKGGPKGNISNVYHLTLDNPLAVSPGSTGGVAPDSIAVSPDSTGAIAPDSTRTSHSFEPVIEPKDHLSSKPDDIKSDPPKLDLAKQVIQHLNTVTGSKYQACKSNVNPISGRLSDGYTVEELCMVINHKQIEWGNDGKMAQYMRPSTLFQPSKFAGYLQAAKIAVMRPGDRPVTLADFDDTTWGHDLGL
ncbi:conserved phage C-terminal domain-containing protein [Photobacterium nomapromontoriensis]|uniref:conserved phage C-terminal domain-containing protein n=1 Tax=Photobacterium nomapromontoriensis TaxID=2910237 RepID=UPI003D0C6A34